MREKKLKQYFLGTKGSTGDQTLTRGGRGDLEKGVQKGLPQGHLKKTSKKTREVSIESVAVKKRERGRRNKRLQSKRKWKSFPYKNRGPGNVEAGKKTKAGEGGNNFRETNVSLKRELNWGPAVELTRMERVSVWPRGETKFGRRVEKAHKGGKSTGAKWEAKG